jgi:hypothetical protein
MSLFTKCGAEAGLVNGFFGPDAIAFAAKFAFGRKSAGTLFAGARFSFSAFLSFTGKTGFGDRRASASRALGTALAAESFALVSVAFAGPLVFRHTATRAGGRNLWDILSGLFFGSASFFHIMPFS